MKYELIEAAIKKEQVEQKTKIKIDTLNFDILMLFLVATHKMILCFKGINFGLTDKFSK